MKAGTAALVKAQQWTSSNGHNCHRLPRGDNTASAKQRCIRSTHSSTGQADVENVENSRAPAAMTPHVREKLADRDFYLSVLNSTSTKREARAYLSKYTPGSKKSSAAPSNPASSGGRAQQSQGPLGGRMTSPAKEYGVNLGNLYTSVKALEQRSVFSHYHETETPARTEREPIHLALIKLRSPELLDDATLEGVGLTLSQLGRLGLATVVVTDQGSEAFKAKIPGWRDSTQRQAARVITAIEKHSGPGARRLDNIIGISSIMDQSSSSVSLRDSVQVADRDQLLAPLRRGITPVIEPVGYATDTQQALPVDADEVVLDLTREFSGIISAPVPDEDPSLLRDRIADRQRQVSLERLIILDPLGGIPGSLPSGRSHLFINLEQEFDDIKADLLRAQSNGQHDWDISEARDDVAEKVSDLGRSNPFSSFAETQIPGVPSSWRAGQPSDQSAESSATKSHLGNLELLQRTLALLPPSCSALLTTPDEAANAGRSAHNAFVAADVGTRRQKNPLIHNLLTDKPLFSSSLPSGRLGTSPSAQHDKFSRTFESPTTFIKRGMPLTILPDPRTTAWIAPEPGQSTLNLNDPRIDLPRLIHLIEDSFNRELDVEHYLSRIHDRIAGVIIAGEYEGGALLTWETPSPSPSPSPTTSEHSEPTTSDSPRTVPYLDKFAVLKRSQGAGGVADILFNAMVRSCLPAGVCWRSRRDNPVNKWYFERARGTLKIPDSNWTMFWTTENLALGSGSGLGGEDKSQTFLDYESVCRRVEPSWKDRRKAAD